MTRREALARAIVARKDQPFDYLLPKRQQVYLRRAEDGFEALDLPGLREKILRVIAEHFQ